MAIASLALQTMKETEPYFISNVDTWKGKKVKQ